MVWFGEAWVVILGFCDISTAKALLQTSPLLRDRIMFGMLQKTAVSIVTRFLKDTYEKAPWRQTNHPFEPDFLDMSLYNRVTRTKLGEKFYRQKLIRYVLDRRNMADHYSNYLFSFTSPNQSVESQREHLRSLYFDTGSQYVLAKYVETMTFREIIHCGI